MSAVSLAALLAGCAVPADGSLNDRGITLIQSGSYAEAEPVLVRALRSAEQQSANSLQTSNALYNLGWLYRLEGRYGEAEPLLHRALLIQDPAPDAAKLFLPETLNEYGYILTMQGRYAQAEPLFRRALSLQERTQERMLTADDPALAITLENLGYLYRLQERYSESRPLYERARSIRERTLGPNNPALARTLTNLGTLYVLQGRPGEAEPLELRALRIRETALGANHPQVADSLYDLGRLYRAEHRFGDSEQALKRGIAVQEAASGPYHPIVATRGYEGLAQVYKDQNRLAEALAASDRATDILQRQLNDGRGTRAVAATTERRLYRNIFLENIALTFSAGQAAGGDPAARSIVTAQYAAAVTAGEALARMAAQFAANDNALATDIRALQDLGDRWRQLDAQLLKAVGDSAADQDAVAQHAAARSALRASLDATERELSTLAEKVDRDFPEYADIIKSRALSLPEIQRLLAPDEAMLVYVTGSDATWLWAVRKGSAQLYRLDISADQLSAAVGALRAFLDPDLNPSLKPYPAQQAYGLYQKILAPAEPVIRGAHSLLVVADGALQSLPLSALVTEAPSRNPATTADHRSVHWLAADYAVAVLPSVSSLHALRTFARASRASAPFFGVGNPVLGGSDQPQAGPGRGFVTGVGPVLAPAPSARQLRSAASPGETTRALNSLPSLPETAIELEAIAQITRASRQDLLLGRQATEQEVRNAPLDRYRVIEFATHGLKPGDLGLTEPALVLTPSGRPGIVDDGLFTASKVATLKLDADWVVLSACNTAAGEELETGGFSALAAAFFHAGARSVLISQWSVPSGPTVLLTAGAFAALADNPGIGRSEALRRSMMAMLGPSKPPEFAHPLVWAPFSLAGDAGR